MTTTRYPIDFDRYNRGDVISVDVIEHAYGIERSSRDAYKLAQLKMREAARKAFADRGEIVSIRARGDDLMILTHSQASPNEERIARQRRRQFRNAHVRHSAVDVGELRDEESRQRHLRENVRNGRMLQAMSEAGHKPIEPKPIERIAPPVKK